MTTLTAAADTVTRVVQSELSARDLVLLGGSMMTAILALIGVGVQFGRHDEARKGMQQQIRDNKEEADRRLTVLETTDGHSITREELNARFSESASQIAGLNRRFDDFMRLMEQMMKVNRGGI